MNVIKQKKIDSFFGKTPIFDFQEKKYMPLKLFEFLEKIIVGTFSIKITEITKTGSIDKFLLRCEI